VHQLGAEYLQTPRQLFSSVLYFTIDVRSSVEFVAEVNIHSRLGTGEDPVKLFCYNRILHPSRWHETKFGSAVAEAP
jgi:hypothetical protein